MNRRYCDIPQPQVNDSDCADVGGLRCLASVFKAEAASQAKGVTGVDTAKIEAKGAWPHYSPQSLATKQLALIMAMLGTEQQLWERLWLNVFLRSGWVVCREDVYYLVLLTTSYLSFAIRLVWDDSCLGYKMDAESLWCRFIVTDLTTWALHEYAISLTDKLELVFALDSGRPPLEYILKHTVQQHTSTLLRKALSKSCKEAVEQFIWQRSALEDSGLVKG